MPFPTFQKEIARAHQWAAVESESCICRPLPIFSPTDRGYASERSPHCPHQLAILIFIRIQICPHVGMPWGEEKPLFRGLP